MRALEPLELCQQRPQGMATMELVGAVGEHQQHSLRAQVAGHVGGEGARGSVGPVHVLEHERDWSGGADQVEQFEHGLEQPQLIARLTLAPGARAILGQGREQGRELRAAGRAELSQRRVVGARERAQRAQQWGVGQLTLALLHTFAAQHERRVGTHADAPGELRDQARLADPRLAAQQDDGGAAVGCVTQRVL